MLIGSTPQHERWCNDNNIILTEPRRTVHRDSRGEKPRIPLCSIDFSHHDRSLESANNVPPGTTADDHGVETPRLHHLGGSESDTASNAWQEKYFHQHYRILLLLLRLLLEDYEFDADFRRN